MKNIQAIKIGNTINISIDGKLIQKSFDDSQKAKKFYSLIVELKENPNDETLLNEFYKIVDNDIRIAYLAGLEHNKRTGEVFLAGFSTPLPKSLLGIIEEYHTNNYPLDAIINFWKLLMVNPDKRVRENLFHFISKHDFVLTDKGYMIVYKAVEIKTAPTLNNDFDNYVISQYHHVKNDWKSAPNKYVVYRHDDDRFAITKKETADSWNEDEKNIIILGKLGDLYAKIIEVENKQDDEIVYTDMYSRTMEIRIGEIVKMNREKCDADPQKDCSYGLHVGATRYVQNYVNRSSKILVCLVNPSNVVAVPDYDKSKMRVSEYFPFATANYENGKIEIIEQKYFEHDYIQHEIKTLEGLIEKVKAEELPFEKAINGGENETRSMSEIMKMLKSRLVDINI